MNKFMPLEALLRPRSQFFTIRNFQPAKRIVFDQSRRKLRDNMSVYGEMPRMKTLRQRQRESSMRSGESYSG